MGVFVFARVLYTFCMKIHMTEGNYRTIISVLLLALIVAASLGVVELQKARAARLPYTIGSPVTTTGEMPAGMVMKSFDVPAAEVAPTVVFSIMPDSMGGYDVHVVTTDFTFAPEHLGGAPVAGEGHAHLYIDNDLIVMLGDWYHIDALSPGTHTIRVGLFNNDHSAYEVGGRQIQAQQRLTVPKA